MIRESTKISLDLQGTAFQDYERSGLLFFDIETTGFSAKTAQLYLIGAIYYDGSGREGRGAGWMLTQWLAEASGEERGILQDFLEQASEHTMLIHFNGDRFDIPFLLEKCRAYGLPEHALLMAGRDLYRLIRPLKTLLALPAQNQRSLKEYLGIFREDPYGGGELIRVYQKYVVSPSRELLRTLLLHNYEDLLGMLSVLGLLSYLPILEGSYRVLEAWEEQDAVLIHAQLPLVLPQPFSFQTDWISLSGEEQRFSARVRGKRGALKYFFPDYKNYYYLPAEDTAIHKSVAAYVDKAYREPAKASTCYSRKKGFYLPQFSELFTPVFWEEYQKKPAFFSCTREFLSDREGLQRYLSHLILHFAG